MGRLQRKRIKMATELELAEEMSNSSPERAMELLSSIGEPQFLMLNIMSMLISLCYVSDTVMGKTKVNWAFSMNLNLAQLLFVVKRDIQAGDEEGIKMKEQGILNLGKMLSKHGKAEGT